MDTENLVKECQERSKNGNGRDEVVEYLHGAGLTITESIKIVKQVFGISLGEAKDIVSRHANWNEVVAAAKPLQDDLVQVFAKGTNSEPVEKNGPFVP